MNSNTVSASPRRFTLIGIFATLWYLLGCAMWFAQITMSPQAIAKLTPGEQSFYNSVPGWYDVVFGIAVFAGLAGCIALLMRRAVALPLFVLSLGAVLVQNFYGFVVLKAIELMGAAAITVPVLVIAIGMLMVWFTHSSRGRGHLS